MYDIERHRPLADQLGFWIVRLAQAVKADHAVHLNAYGVNLTQYWTLRVVRERADATPSGLAATLGIDRAQATRVVQGLAKRGLIRRSRDGKDLRIVHLEVTDRATDLLTRLDAAVARAERDLEEGLTREQRAELARLLADRLRRTGGWDPADI